MSWFPDKSWPRYPSGLSALLFRLAPKPLKHFLDGELLLSERGEAMALAELLVTHTGPAPGCPAPWAESPERLTEVQRPLPVLSASAGRSCHVGSTSRDPS